MKSITLILSLLLCLTSMLQAEVAVTIYNQNTAVVRETRHIDFPKGISETRFENVASEIDPTSVHFTSDRINLLEQNYDYDLVDSHKLFQKYLGQQVKFYTLDGEQFAGELLSAHGDIVLRENNNSVRSFTRDKIFNVQFPQLPEGLITRPSLVWLVDVEKAGSYPVEISYLTSGVSWTAEYVVVLNDDENGMGFSGWANITNNCGTAFTDATIKLMAGDVQFVNPRRDRGKGRYMLATAEATIGNAFTEKSFHEYHLYTLGRPATLKNDQIKQISLFPSAEIKTVNKEFRFNWHEWQEQVKVFFEVENTRRNGLEIPLPEGKVRMFKKDTDGALEFIGEDWIKHTPANESIRVSTGFAFDVLGERKVVAEEDFKGGKDFTVEFNLKNRKKEAVKIILEEKITGNWEIQLGSPGWKKTSATTLEWEIRVPANSDKKITYRAISRWGK